MGQPRKIRKIAPNDTFNKSKSVSPPFQMKTINSDTVSSSEVTEGTTSESPDKERLPQPLRHDESSIDSTCPDSIDSSTAVASRHGGILQMNRLEKRRVFTFSPVSAYGLAHHNGKGAGHVGFAVGHTIMASERDKFISQSAPCSPKGYCKCSDQICTAKLIHILAYNLFINFFHLKVVMCSISVICHLNEVILSRLTV